MLRVILPKMNKIRLLSISIALIYFWFGVLKFFPELSPAETIATQTIGTITFHLIPSNLSYGILAFIEISIGLGLILFPRKKAVIWAALVHMICTFVPLFAFPELSFTKPPYGFTILGQYIMKNIIIIMALLVLLPSKKEYHDNVN